jgi:hypothetical protein
VSAAAAGRAIKAISVTEMIERRMGCDLKEG